MSLATRWTRRTFLANAAFASAAMASSSSSYAVATNPEERTSRAFLTCIASSHQLKAFIYRGQQKQLLAALRSPEPFGTIALHPNRNVVYAAFDAEQYLGLPRSSVAAFAIEESSQSFVLLSRQALTLSATHPRHLSVSPDGKTVLVCATGGGAYNSFEASADGSLLSPPHSLKLTGCGPHPLQPAAQPVFSVFHRSSGCAYACDFGSDRIDHVDFVDGVPLVRSRAALLPGSGPCHLSIHPSEQLLAVVSTLRPAVTLFRIDSETGHLAVTSQCLIPGAAALDSGRFQTSGDEFYVSGRTHAGPSTTFILRTDRALLELYRESTHEPSERLLSNDVPHAANAMSASRPLA